MKLPLWMVVLALCLPATVSAQTASAASASSRTIRCGSDSGRRVVCTAGGQVASARLARELSSSRCAAAGGWGWTSDAVWADNGCRGEFSVSYGAAVDSATTRRIECGTLSSRKQQCSAKGPVDSVRLVRRSFFSTCNKGSNWGYGDTLVWAGNGCKGVFEVTYRDTTPARPVPPPVANTRTVVCGSYSDTRVTCQTEGPATGVRLVRDYTGKRCREGASWGHTDAFIWTSRGCRGDFEITYRDGPPATGSRRITCGSGSSIQMQCSTQGHATRVGVVRDLGSSRCRQGDNWRYTASEIVAGNGCRAEFEVTYGKDSAGMRPVAPPRRVISCGNTSGSAMSCNAFGTVATVRLQLDRSNGRCGQSGSWGLGDQSIWVTRGCYGDFELTYTG
ncbi:MAG TPA: DUF3011 domain-containing protein [Gemmatimonadales bacterium]